MLLKQHTTNSSTSSTNTLPTPPISNVSLPKRGGRKLRGGSYNSGTTYNEYVNGSGDAQYNRVFDQGGMYDTRPSNLLIGAQGQWSQPTNAPTAQNLSLIQSAGTRRRRKRGGYWGQVINQAAAPLALLGMQQSFRRKKHMGSHHSHSRRR